MRTTLTDAARTARMGMARATIREVDDNHLMQEVKKADVYHNETPTDFERWQMCGISSVPCKQQEDPNKTTTVQQSSGGDDAAQPTGPAAEALMLYLNGSRSHPVCIVDDRRVRPYDMSEGEGCHYAPDGSEQMVLFKETGCYVVSLDGKSVKDKDSNKTRFASLRHVNKKMQSHKIDSQQQQNGSQSGGSTVSRLDTTTGSGQQQQKYKHEGDSVNTEVRCTKGRIEFRDGDNVMGYYETSSKKWHFNGTTLEHEFSGDYTLRANNILDKPQGRHELEDGATSPVEGKLLDLSTKVFINPLDQDTETRRAMTEMSMAFEALNQKIAELEERIAVLEG